MKIRSLLAMLVVVACGGEPGAIIPPEPEPDLTLDEAEDLTGKLFYGFAPILSTSSNTSGYAKTDCMDGGTVEAQAIPPGNAYALTLKDCMGERFMFNTSDLRMLNVRLVPDHGAFVSIFDLEGAVTYDFDDRSGYCDLDLDIELTISVLEPEVFVRANGRFCEVDVSVTATYRQDEI